MCFGGVEQKKLFCLGFWSLNDKEKGMTKTFSGKKLTKKLYLVYLEVNLQESRCACCI